MYKLLLLAFCSIALVGCSDRQLYHAGQEYQKNKCIDEAVNEQQYNDCLNINQSFKEYDTERKIIISH